MARRKPAPAAPEPAAPELAAALSDATASAELAAADREAARAQPAIPPEDPTEIWPRSIELDLGDGMRALCGCAALPKGHRWWVTVEGGGVKATDLGAVDGGRPQVEAAQAAALVVCRRKVMAALAAG